MHTKLERHGDNLVLVIDKSFLKSLDVDAETEFEVSTDGEVLVLKPLRNLEDKAFREALDKANTLYADDLKRLAE